VAEQLNIGDTLEGKYVIHRKIGEGGMGVVYEGQHRELEMKVAIKVLHPIEADDPSMIDRFKTEAKSSASIKHPNVVEVYDYGLTPDGRPFFVMEFLGGESLADLLDRVKVLKTSQVVEIIDQILTGLSRAHKRNIIHRDLKPENIFLAKTEEGKRVVKILDFGIAKIARGGEGHGATLAVSSRTGQAKLRATRRFRTEHGVVMGTPGYMAPESLTGQTNIDTRADLFAVGVLLFEMLTGRQPFRGETAHEIMLNTANRPVPDIRALNPAVSSAMEQLCLIALAKNPDDRFQTAEEFIDYLTAAAVDRIPEHGRKCRTDVGIPSLVPPAPPARSEGSGLELDVDPLDTGSLRAHSPRPVASDTNNRMPPAWDPHAPRQKVKRWQPAAAASAPGDTRYVGPPRRRRIIFPFSLFEVLIFAAIVGGALYLIRTSSFFRTPQQTDEKAGYEIYRSASEKRVEDGYKARLPATVPIWVDVEPSDAQVLWNGELMTDRPFRVPGGSLPVKVEVVKEGYVRRLLVVTPDGEKTIHAVLEKESPKKIRR